MRVPYLEIRLRCAVRLSFNFLQSGLVLVQQIQKMEDHPTGAVPFKSERASLLGLPAELRMPIYCELFRIRIWEAHQARNKDLASPKRRLNDQCPVCHCSPKDGDYLYPTCRLVCKNNELVLAPLCYTPSRPYERTNRCAILTACRATYNEAADYLYANTLFMVFLGEYHPGGAKITDAQSVNESFKLRSEWKSLLSRAQNLRMRVDVKGHNEIGTLKVQISEVMNSVLRDRRRSKIQLQVLTRGDGAMEGISLTAKDDSSVHPRFRMVLCGISYLVSRSEWYMFLLKHILPACLLELVDKIVATGNDMERISDLNMFLTAVHRAQLFSSATDGDVHVA